MKFWPRGDNPHAYGTRLKTRMALLWLALFVVAAVGALSLFGILKAIQG